MQGLDVLLGVEDRELLALITRCLEEQPLFRLRGTVSSIEDLGEALGRTDPHCVFLSDRLAGEIGALCEPEALLATLRSSLVFTVGRESDANGSPPCLPVVQRLEFPCDGRMLFQQLSRLAAERSRTALLWLHRHREGAEAGAREGPRTLLLQGAKGGAGTSFLAARLAAFTARVRDTLLIDFDLQGAALSNLFDTPARRSLADLFPLGAEITSAALESVVRRHPAGFKLLPAPLEPEWTAPPSKSGLSEALQAIFLRQDLTILDVPHGLDDVCACLHVLCQRSLLVFTPDVLAVRILERKLGLLRRLSLGGERIGLILNRAGSQHSLGAPQVESYLRIPVLASVREDPAAGIEFAEMGNLPDSPASLREMAELATALGVRADLPGRARRGRRASEDPGTGRNSRPSARRGP